MTRPCLLIVTGSRLAAEQAAVSHGLDPRIVLEKRDCVRPLAPVRRRAHRMGIETVAIHSQDWQRQALPQLFELAALRIGLPAILVLAGDAPDPVTITRAQLARRASRVPVDGLEAVMRVGSEALRLARRPELNGGAGVVGDRDAVLAVWPGAPGVKVGGAITHMAGILAAFKEEGFRIGLLSIAEPPNQLSDLADEIELAAPLPPAARLTREIASLSSNQSARRAGERLLARLRPRLIYQRHEAFVTYGLDLARSAGVPLVLEWNNSEVWALRHWHVSHPLKRMFTPLGGLIERHVLRSARLTVAVSKHSAQEAIDLGAPPGSVLVLPNGVDLKAIDRARPDAAPSSGPGALVGWVGSFDPWHGAEVLVRALCHLPEHVRAVLIGDGQERQKCVELAKELGVHERAEFTGPLPHTEAVRRLWRCEVLASPHVPMETRPFFGSPTKIFEYMAIGRPIVASTLEQMAEILDDHRTAVLVTPGDADDLARGISEVLDLPDRGEEIGRRARREAEERHTWGARVRVILATLDGEADRGRDAIGELALSHSTEG
jgi:glycosyltransferase involved in cell wall biosynthesis